MMVKHLPGITDILSNIYVYLPWIFNALLLLTMALSYCLL